MTTRPPERVICLISSISKITIAFQAVEQAFPTSSKELFQMRNRIPQTLKFLGLIIAIMSFGVVSANAKSTTSKPKPASTITSNPTPEQKSTVVVEKPGEVMNVNSKASSTVTVTMLQWETANGLSKKVVDHSTCWMDNDGFWNSGISNGVKWWFWDTRPSKICRLPNGKMYRVLCGNEVRSTPPPDHIVTGIVVLVRFGGKYKASVSEKASAKAKDWCGEATASASASATVSGYTKMQARGNAKLVASVKATLKAQTSASAKVICGPKPSATPAPQGSGCVGPTNTTATASGIPCQSASQSTSQAATATATPTCVGNVQNSCNTTIQIYVTNTSTINQYNCSKVTQVYSDGTSMETWYAKDSSVTTEQICSQQSNNCSQASDSSQCSETPPSGCTSDCTPPPAPTPPSITLSMPQEFYENETYVAVANATATSGHQLKVCFTADYGGFSPSCVSTTATGSPVEVRSTYTAPVDVSSDRLTSTVYDLTSGLNGSASVTKPVLKQHNP